MGASSVAGAARRRPTSNDVARLAGCSQAAVSLWLSRKQDGRLKPELQERIAAAAAELGYVPNRTAQRLSLGDRHALSFVFPGYTYHFFGTILEGATGTLGTGWELSFFDSRTSRDLQGATRLVTQAVGADTAGLLLASPSRDELRAIANVTSTAIVVDAPTAPASASLVAFDVDESIGSAARELAALGHRKVGYVSFTAESLTLSHRREVAGKAFKRHGISIVGPDLRLSRIDVDDTANRFAQKIGRWRQDRVTAILCADDRHAYGVLRACRAMSLNVPGDLSLVAFNDSEPAGLLDPPLASIRLPAVELGATAGRALLTHITTGEPTRQLVTTSWHARGSIGPAES